MSFKLKIIQLHLIGFIWRKIHKKKSVCVCIHIYIHTYIPKSPSAFGVGDVCPNVVRWHHKNISLDHKSKRQNMVQISSQKKSLQSHLHLLENEQKPTTTNTNLSFPNKKKHIFHNFKKKRSPSFWHLKTRPFWIWGFWGTHCWYL